MPCQLYQQCSQCLKNSKCVWCANNESNGAGVCIESSLNNTSCDFVLENKSNQFSWNYIKCPAENECANGHHICNNKTEICIDQKDGYECVCAENYKKDENGICKPVCSQGCVRGVCMEPNVCKCDFGYVGANCSIQCLCNGHSNCEGPDRLDKCLECKNNTTGERCEKCLPLFVGDPRNNGICTPCLTYCNGHTEICLHSSNSILDGNLMNEFISTQVEGPKSDAICIGCKNNTSGNRCETCISGFFRGSTILQNACRKCECNQHGEICDSVTGEKCNCQNNTESDNTCSKTSKGSAFSQCWASQCSKCRESFYGHPTNGHQCYKQITVESKMCFDSKSIGKFVKQ